MTQPLRSRDPDLNKLHETNEVFRKFEPLAIGIGGKAGLTVMSLETGMTTKQIKVALGQHVNSYQYRSNLQAGKARVGLDGKPYGEPVTKEQADNAQDRLRQHRAKNKGGAA